MALAMAFAHSSWVVGLAAIAAMASRPADRSCDGKQTGRLLLRSLECCPMQQPPHPPW